MSTPTYTELHRAAQALESGAFRDGTPAVSETVAPVAVPAAPVLTVAIPEGDVESLEGPSITVTGTVGGIGASTFALALGEVLPSRTRVLECNTFTTGVLAAATQAELGADPAGWRQGTRNGSHDRVLIQRAPRATSSAAVPHPADLAHDIEWTILDPGWPLATLQGWIRVTTEASHTVVVLTNATVPGIERLEALLTELTDRQVIAVVTGPRIRRWPAPVSAAAGPKVRDLIETGALVDLAPDRGLHIQGLTPAELPTSLTTAAAAVAQLITTSLPATTWSTGGTGNN